MALALSLCLNTAHQDPVRHQELYDLTAGFFPQVNIGTGTLIGFAELQRRQPLAGASPDVVTHCTTPIVHDASDEAVMQTTAALPHITKAVRKLYPEAEYHLSTAIGLRFNPWNCDIDNPNLQRLAMKHRDPRQAGLFAAAYTVAVTSGVTRDSATMPNLLTLGEVSGCRGWECPSDITDQLSIQTGVPVSPIYHVVKWLASVAGKHQVSVTELTPDSPLRLIAVQGSMVLANIGSVPCTVDVQLQSKNGAEPSGRSTIMLQLDRSNSRALIHAMGNTSYVPEALLDESCGAQDSSTVASVVRLGPFAVAWITWSYT